MSRYTPSQVRDHIKRLFLGGSFPAEPYEWNESQAPKVGALIDMLDGLDPRLLEQRLDAAARVRLAEAKHALIHALAKWGTEGARERSVGGHRLNVQHIVRIHELLMACDKDEADPAAELRRLVFVADEALRENLSRDIASIERLVAAGEWKAATVLGGSIIEALLLDALEKREASARDVKSFGAKKGWNKPLDEWPLEWMIQAGAALDILSDEDRQTCGLSQRFRNLIHAGRERAKETASKATALQAQAAVERLLQKWE